MRRAALALAALLAAAPAASQTVREGLASGLLAPADGYDVDALLRRAREQEERYVDRRYPLFLEERRRESERAALSAAQLSEIEARRRHEAERNRVELEAHGPPRAPAERLLDLEAVQRLRIEAERARRRYDDSIPELWRR